MWLSVLLWVILYCEWSFFLAVLTGFTRIIEEERGNPLGAERSEEFIIILLQ